MAEELTKEKIKEMMLQQEKMLKHYLVHSIELFGPYAEDAPQKEGSIDLLVEFDESATMFDVYRFEEDLRKLFSKKVIVIPKNNITTECSACHLKETKEIAIGLSFLRNIINFITFIEYYSDNTSFTIYSQK